MKKINRLYVLGSIMVSGLFMACADEEVEFYSAENGALDFATLRVEYSYARETEKGDRVLQVPVNVVGPAVDYDRKVSFRVVTDSCQNVSDGDYSIADTCVVKAGELTANIDVQVHYTEDLADTSKLLTLQLLENEYFGIGLPASNMADVYWTDLLVRPHLAIWRTWWQFFSQTYSRKFHEVIIEALGEEMEIYYLYSTTDINEHPEFVRITNQAWWYAANRKLREYVAAYDAAHPDAPLMHSDDAEYFRSYSLAVGSGVSRAGYTIAETLKVL